MIRDANKKKYHYIPLNNYWQCVELTRTHYYLVSGFKNCKFDLYLPDNFIVCGGAQFIVSKERIRSRPLDFYKQLYECVSTREDAVSLELLWHIIFGELYSIVPRRDHFVPRISQIKYSSATMVPMRTSELKIKKMQERDPEFDNSGTTYISSGPKIQNTGYEIKYIVEDELDNCLDEMYKRCLLFENLYLEALGA